MGYIHTRKLGYYLCGVSCTADGIGIIDLTLAMRVKVDEGVAMDGDERDLLILRINAREHDGV